MTRLPLIIGGYANPLREEVQRNSYLHSLIEKQGVEKVIVWSSLGFYRKLFLVPKPKKWRPIMDLSTLSVYVKTESLKMDTPKVIRLSL